MRQCKKVESHNGLPGEAVCERFAKFDRPRRLEAENPWLSSMCLVLSFRIWLLAPSYPLLQLFRDAIIDLDFGNGTHQNQVSVLRSFQYFSVLPANPNLSGTRYGWRGRGH